MVVGNKNCCKIIAHTPIRVLSESYHDTVIRKMILLIGNYHPTFLKLLERVPYFRCIEGLPYNARAVGSGAPGGIPFVKGTKERQGCLFINQST
jgi:hypothetical protein